MYSEQLYNYVVVFIDQKLPLQTWRRRLHTSDKREKLDQELARALDTGRRAGEELSNKSRELSGENRAIPFSLIAQRSFLCLYTDLLLGL